MIYTIVFSNHCDLDCSYCCVGNKNTSRVLSLEEVEKVFQGRTPGFDDVIEFYGGEPTLHYELMKEVVLKYRDKTAFYLMTNGLFNGYTEEMFEFLVENMTALLISLDGIDYESNKQRFKTEEEFNTVVENIKKATSRYPYKVRLSSTLFGKNKIEGIVKNGIYAHDEWGVDFHTFTVIRSFANGRYYELSDAHKVNLYLNLTELVIQMYKRGNRDIIYISLEDVMNSTGRSCTDHCRAISPRGTIYMCRELAANEEYNKVTFPNHYSFGELRKDNTFQSSKKYEIASMSCCPLHNMRMDKSGNKEENFVQSELFQEAFMKPFMLGLVALQGQEVATENVIELFTKLKNILIKYALQILELREEDIWLISEKQ